MTEKEKADVIMLAMIDLQRAIDRINEVWKPMLEEYRGDDAAVEEMINVLYRAKARAIQAAQLATSAYDTIDNIIRKETVND